jgi:hypothetical protein
MDTTRTVTFFAALIDSLMINQDRCTYRHLREILNAILPRSRADGQPCGDLRDRLGDKRAEPRL